MLHQYLPNKPHKWGYKLLVLCDDRGFANDFEIYSEMENNPDLRLPNEPDLGAWFNWRQSGRKLLPFYGVKGNRDEDVRRSVIALLSNKMKIPDITEHLSSCHRLGIKRESAHPIIVRFSDLQLRSKAWKTKTSLRGTEITITEFLTKPCQEIFVAAHNHFSMKKCWAADGVIVILLPHKYLKKVTTLSALK
ncbi:unnamed protein product [Euphydryas editha]|uniref:PiggyBac transposable element-derived protein domain-containing protein n=1 Tax=Euphydryas editha TaxID=104508 RepID=A0AAU9VBY6_EUPED|nr:unnamed protein product [Euphydryas editha]